MSQPWARGFYNSKEWHNTREYILRRDNYLCRHCGRPAEEVHHIIKLTPKNIYDPKISMNPQNLISLCKDCHFAEHTQDKANGIRKNKSKDCDEGFMFDENGQLVRVEGEPAKI